MSFLRWLRQIFGARRAARPSSPSSPDTATLAVVVLNSRDQPVADAVFRVGEAPRTATNADGYAAVASPLGEVAFAVEKDGYTAVHATVEVHGNTQMRVTIDPLVSDVPVGGARPRPLVGRLRIEQGAFVDDTGPVLPLFCHAGDLFALWVRQPERVRQQLDLVAQAGYHGLRVWTLLGGSYWERMQGGRTVSPSVTPNYWAQWEAFVTEVHRRGLRLVVSQGDINQVPEMPARRDFATKLAAVARSVDGTGHVYAFVDGGNEAWQTGEPDPARLAEFVQTYRNAGGTALLTLTSPPGEEKEQLDAYSIPPADCYDVHGYRDGHHYDKRRHIFSIPYEGQPHKRLGIQSEPNGAGALVSVTDNKSELNDEALAVLAAQSLIARQAYVWFSGEGVSVDRGLETEPGFWNTPVVCAQLPVDVMRFRTLHHSGATWTGTRIVDNGVTHETRVDGAIDGDGRCVYLFDGPAGTHTFRAARTFRGVLCDPRDGRVEPFEKVAGDVFSLTWDRGRLFIGRAE